MREFPDTISESDYFGKSSIMAVPRVAVKRHHIREVLKFGGCKFAAKFGGIDSNGKASLEYSGK